MLSIAKFGGQRAIDKILLSSDDYLPTLQGLEDFPPGLKIKEAQPEIERQKSEELITIEI